MSYLLAWETVTRGGSVAVADEAGAIIESTTIADNRGNAELVPTLMRYREQFGVPQALACAVGPGSFTGLRVSVITARTLAMLDNIPIHAVCSLQAMCYAAGPGTWWPTFTLKRDTTFHALMAVAPNGALSTQEPIIASEDTHTLDWDTKYPQHAFIGAAINDKQNIFTELYKDIPRGTIDGVTAVGVALAARHSEAQPWEKVLPVYHQKSAPELQREAAAQKAASSS